MATFIREGLPSKFFFVPVIAFTFKVISANMPGRLEKLIFGQKYQILSFDPLSNTCKFSQNLPFLRICFKKSLGLSEAP